MHSCFSDSSTSNQSSNTKAALLMFSQSYFSKAYALVLSLSSISSMYMHIASCILLLHEKINYIYLHPVSWSLRHQQNHSKTFHIVYNLSIYVHYNITVLMLLTVWITQSSFMVSIPSKISMQNGFSYKGSKWLSAWLWLFKLKFSIGSSEVCWYINQNSEEINTSLSNPHLLLLLFSLH